MSWLSRIAGGVLAGMLLCISVSFADDNATSNYGVSVDPMVKVRTRDHLRKKLGNDDDLRSLCSGLKMCMNQVFEGCFEDDMKPWPKVKYDDEFCKPFKEIDKRGYKADPKAPMVPEIYEGLAASTAWNTFTRERFPLTKTSSSTCLTTCRLRRS